MVKLFLVEDEIAMRNGIRRHIRWEEEGIDFCGEAGDGELAWPMIKEQRPDIVITDIKMPFMDGLQLSGLIRKELPETKIVILSGYSEFRYAQEALRMGVAEYLLKPITPKDLREVIRRLAKSIEEEKKDQEARMDWMLEEERERENSDRRRLFKALISGEHSSHEILEMADETGLSLGAPLYQLLLIYVRYEADYKNQGMIENALRTLEDVFPGCYLFEHSVDSNALLLTERTEEALDERREQVLARLTSSIKAVGNLHYFISIGRTVRHLREIHSAYHEANRTSGIRFFVATDRIVTTSTPLKQLLSDADSGKIDTETALQQGNLQSIWGGFLRTGTLSEAEDFVEDTFSSVGEENVKSTLFLNYMTMDCYFSMARFLKELGREPGEVEEKLGDINTALRTMGTAEDSRRFLSAYLQEVLRLRDRTASHRSNQMLRSAVEYIDANYTDSDLSLQTVASVAGLSPNRFSTLFSKEMNMTFIEYLIGKRMERARELLMTTNLRSSEITYQTGYKDPHYFSATFKKIHGISPKEYRMRGKQEHESGRA